MTAKGKGRKAKPTAISTTNTLSSFLAKEPMKVWMIGVGIAVVFCALTFNPNLGIQGDNANYVILAQSVWKGPFMHNVNFPVPKPSQTLPAGFPLLLAPVAAISGNSIMAMKLWVTLLFLVSLPLLFYLIRFYTTAIAAALVLLLVAINPFLLEYSHWIMSEIPFWAVVVGGLYLLKYADERKAVWKNPWMWAGLVLIGYSYWIRSLGVAAILAVGLHYLIRKQWGRLVMSVAVVGAVVMPWVLISRGLGGTEYLQQLIMINPYRAELGTVGISELLGRVGRNFVTYFGWELPKGILPILPESHAPGALPIWGFLVSLLWAIGFIPFIIRHRERVGFYVLVTLGICLMWPEVWSTLRFAYGILPFLVFFMVEGVRNIARWLPGVVTPSIRTPFGVVLGVFIIIASVYPTISTASQGKGYAPNWRDYFSAGQWIKSHTPGDAIVCCRKPYLMYLTAERKTTYFIRDENPEQVLRTMEDEGVDYVIYDALGFSDTLRFLKPTIERFPERFRAVWKGSYSNTYLFELEAKADSTRQ